MISNALLRQLAHNLPQMVILSDFPYGPSERLAYDFLNIGIKLSIVHLTTDLNFQQGNDILKSIREVPDNSKKNLQRLKILQRIFQKKHPNLSKDYEYF